MLWLSQFICHVEKQFHTFSVCTLVLKVLLPLVIFLISVLPYYFSSITVDVHPDVVSLPPISQCQNITNCIQIAWSTEYFDSYGELSPIVERVMQKLGSNVGYDSEKVIGFRNENQYLLPISKFMNKREILHYFQFSSYPQTCMDLVNAYVTIGYNATDSYLTYDLKSFDYNIWDLGIVSQYYSAIISVCSRELDPKHRSHEFEINVNGIAPTPLLPVSSEDITIAGTLGFMVALIIPILSVVREIVSERENKMTGYLHVSGSMDTPELLALLVSNGVIIVFNVYLMKIVGMKVGLDLTLNSDLDAYMVTYTIYGMAYITMGIWFAQLFGRIKTSVLLTVFLLVVLVLYSLALPSLAPYWEQMLALIDLGLIEYMPYVSHTQVFFAKLTRVMVPGYHWALLQEVVNYLTVPSLDPDAPKDPQTGLPIVPGFHWSDIAKTFVFGDDDPDDPLDQGLSICVREQLLWLGFQVVFYIVFALYLAIVLRMGYGAKQVPWFFLQPSFWGIGKQDKSMFSLPEIPVSLLPEVEGDFSESLPGEPAKPLDSAVMREATIAQQQASRRGVDSAIVLAGIGRMFKGKKNHEAVHAVRSLWLTVPNNCCLGLLGHNGSGKSTTISMLTGTIRPTRGEGYVMGNNIRTQMGHIRRNTGVVFQDDRLWPKLSPIRHLRLIGQMRGLGRKEAKRIGLQLLKDVDLMDAVNRPAGKMSGGMRRRLSFALAMIGDPKLLFLDEPSSSLDPSSRRDMWKHIKSVSTERTVVLCSHSMEEVDTLSDRVAIVREGSLICLGSPVRLKTKFGAGYRIICDIDGIDVARELARFISRVSPSATLFPPSERQCEFLVSNNKDIANIIRIFECIAPKSGQSTFVSGSTFLEDNALPAALPGLLGWSLKQTQLEDVFMAAANRDVRDEAIVGDDPIESCIVTARFLMENFPHLRSQLTAVVNQAVTDEGIEVPPELFLEILGQKRMGVKTAGDADEQ